VVQEQVRRARADDAAYTPGVPKAELARRHAKEKVEKDLESVHALEAQLDVAKRWTVESPKWMSTVVEIKKRKYQLALDALRLLIVERIFELTKMNQSQAGSCSIYY
jgi:CRISPR/Cas system-associated exonuclease Cas4 (RecB family)